MWIARPGRWFFGYIGIVIAIGVIIYFENRTPAEMVSNNGLLNFPTAVLLASLGASVITFVAARAYHHRRRPLRFGPIGTTLMLAPLWGFVAFALFYRLYWGNGY